MLTAPCYLVPVLRTSGTVSLLSLYALMACERDSYTSQSLP